VIKECEKELRIPIDDAGKENVQKESVEPQESLIAGFQNQSARKRIGFLAVIVLLLLIIGYFLISFQVKDTPRWKIEEIAPQAYDSPTLKAKESYVPGVADKKDAVPGVADKKEKEIDLPAVKPADDSVVAGKNVPQRGAAEIASQTEQLAKVPEVTPFPDRKIVIYFNHNSNDLPDKAYETLDRIADFMVQNPQTTISINGYTDASGAYSYNMSISKFRANMVKGYLVGKGVEAIKIKAAGLGPKDPIASNATEEGRQQNRRVEVELKLDNP
jgi:outer membrane protein OmpA-like peptidoglycan-associated protein